MTCSYCDERSVGSISIPIGDPPSKPILHGLQADTRRQDVRCFCPEHWQRLLIALRNLG